jgi:KaiC/GvpD/RAD55 family RecA-like ATPase
MTTRKRVEKLGSVEWVKIGIPGFNDLLEEGIPKGTNILIAGGPGTGKTVFCLQALYNAAREGHDCLYITFEEVPWRLRRHMEKFGWDFKEVEGKANFIHLKVGGTKGASLLIRMLDPFRITRSVEGLVEKAAGRLSIEMRGIPELIPANMTPYFIALDSLSALESAFIKRPEGYRIYVEQIFRLFEKVGATTFLITETEEAPVRYSRTGIEEFLADGVIVLYNTKVRGQRVQAIEILKLRGAKHERRIVPLQITSNGMKVFSSETVYGAEELK